MIRARLFHGTQEVTGWDPADRGLAYGDGVFETMRVHRGALPWWPRHARRLAEGAARLGLALPPPDFLQAACAEISAGIDGAVLKLILTRGSGGRGYLPTAGAPPSWLLVLHPLPAMVSGLRLAWCGTRLAIQPALAGIKHLNRLEQVLGRMQAVEAGADEGLMQAADGRVACATSGNLVVLRAGRWQTPRLDGFGVAGVCRAWLLEHGLIEEADLQRDDVEAAEAAFVCNAVRGILPVIGLGPRAFGDDPALTSMIRRLGDAEPAFAAPDPKT